MRKIFTLIIISSLLLPLSFFAQTDYRSPMDIPLILSANFGELRSNHFHTGIDIKTEGVINKPVYSIADGYISRISVSPGGYGLAVYVEHSKTGHTTVYGHLNKLTPDVARYVKEQQYEQESFRVNLHLTPEQFPVKKGDLIAYSGNSGSSGGPHVHFEIRDTETGNALDPLLYYKKEIKDTSKPVIKGIAVYPIEEEGVLNNSPEIFRQNITPLKEGGFSSITKKLYAWGKIGIGVHTIDRMNNTSNIYGVKLVKLYCDSSLIFSSDIREVDFNLSKMINTMIDYDYWFRKKTFYMKSFIEPGNKLPIYTSIDNGYILVNEEREYKLRYELEDLYGNKTSYDFTIIGKEQEIPSAKPCSQAMAWNYNNYYISEDFTLIIPAYKLYNDMDFSLGTTEDSAYYSKRYKVNDRYVPLNSPVQMKLKLTSDIVADKRHYGIIQLDGKRPVWIGGEYKDGYITAKIAELGHEYAVGTDNKAPVIAPVQPEQWKTKKAITIKVTDNLSGIASYRGTLNGEYALFERDIKSTNYIYKFDSERLVKGQKYELVFTASDAAGNTSSYQYEFTY